MRMRSEITEHFRAIGMPSCDGKYHLNSCCLSLLRTVTVALFAAGLLNARGVLAGDVVIDDFSNTAQLHWPSDLRMTNLGSKAISDGPRLSGILGGTRQIRVTASTVEVPAVDSVGVVQQRTALSYSSSLGADGSLDLIYDRAGNGLNANLSSAAGIRVDVTAMDAASLPCTMALTLGDGKTTATVNRVLTQAGKQRVDFRFQPGLRAVNVRAIRSIALTVDPARSGDIQLGGIRTFSAGLERFSGRK